MHAMATVVRTPPPTQGEGVSFPPSDHRFIHGGLAASPVVNAQ